jgi:hypothetical protein
LKGKLWAVSYQPSALRDEEGNSLVFADRGRPSAEGFPNRKSAIENAFMDWGTLKKRLRPGGQGSFAPFVLPSMVLEVEPNFVAGARLDVSSGQVRNMGVREVEAGALLPLPHRPNMANEAAVRRAVNEVVEKVGNGSGRLGLLLPDPSVRVATLDFETLPGDRKEAEALVRWRMRATLSYPPEEARVSFQVLARESNSVELLALAVRQSVLGEYEAVLEGVNGGASLVLPATVALLPLLPDHAEAGQLLVHVCSSSVTTVAVAGDRVRFWRNRWLGRTAPEEAWKEVGQEVARVLANCSDHLRVEVSRVWVCVRPPAAEEQLAEFRRALGREIFPLEEGSSSAASLPNPERELFKRYGMTAAGLLANAGRER